MTLLRCPRQLILKELEGTGTQGTPAHPEALEGRTSLAQFFPGLGINPAQGTNGADGIQASHDAIEAVCHA